MAQSGRSAGERGAAARRWLIGLALLLVGGAVVWSSHRAILAEVYARQLGSDMPVDEWVALGRRLNELDPEGQRTGRLEGRARLRFLLATGGAPPRSEETAKAAAEISEEAFAARITRGLQAGLAPDSEPVRLTVAHPAVAREALSGTEDAVVARRAATWLGATGDDTHVAALLAALETETVWESVVALYGAALQCAAGGAKRLDIVRVAYAHTHLRPLALGLSKAVGVESVPVLADLRDAHQLAPDEAFHLSELVRSLTGETLGDDPDAWRTWYAGRQVGTPE
jgi:hypothetical protein